MVRLTGVGKRYGRDRWVLRDVDLVLRPGEVTAVEGANGSGKSTLLRLVAGQSRPTAGTVVDRPAPVGFVPDRFPAAGRWTARAYLTSLGRVRGLPAPDARRRSGELLDRLALVGGADAPMMTLSAGNSQKVAFAQALLVPPRLLVLDEPWSGLDAGAHGELATLVEETARAGAAVLLTDHTGAARPHRRLRCAGGSVAPAGPARLVVRLSAGPGPRPADPARPGADGVHVLDRRGPELHVVVARAASDALLRRALDLGWSVEAVER